ncbi:putative flagellar/basal body protein [Tribonema minus]|uniref:Cilia- and flagella-associated protein 299 n=1 Tax=Tribonema minus TaxID=303371 RepID=A0A835ZKU0_9STRA|nr:putative flagellar/basal body protein [Tribonema minus]
MSMPKGDKDAEGPHLQDTLDTVEQYETYEDYLDSQVTATDMYYLEDEDLARQLVELGYRGSGDTLQRDEFYARKKSLRDRATQKSNAPKQLASAGKNVDSSPFLHALANREELVRNGKLTSIIFIRDKNSKGQEVSGYIDFAQRLKTENFEPYFDKKKKLMPKPSDLSYYNWETQTTTSTSTPNFQVIADSEAGLLFKNKRDRKVINVDPKVPPGDNTTRIEVKSLEYMQVVIYDHMTRRKG